MAVRGDSPCSARRERGRLRILFVCSEDFRGASVKQAVWFAQELLRRGHAVMVSAGGDPDSARTEGVDHIDGLLWRRHTFAGPGLARGDLAAARDFDPTLVHAWNPRVAAIAAAAAYKKATRASLFVHWEDDEWSIRDDPMGRSPARRVARRIRQGVARAMPAQGYAASPRTLAWARDHATGFDALTPMLAARVAEATSRECAVVFPCVPRELLRPEPKPSDPRPAGHDDGSSPDVAPGSATAQVGLPTDLADRPVLLYTASIHPGSVHDLEVALCATSEVRRRGRPAVLVHAGTVLPRYNPGAMARAAGLENDAAVFLGYVPFSAVPGLLRHATVALQPGPPTEFKRLGLPSKLMAYMASGTPTITLSAGFGELLEDRSEVLKTHTGNPSELADLIIEVVSDDRLRDRLAAGAFEAAQRLFDPLANADALEAHYQGSLGSRASAG